ncbi:hypothetical protein [Streptomyces lydicamycinicus]|uniref:hypothetical protein n=1 Tax=Streptomyces lydicamycinicus TaxID=1546107 RepID=UPI0032E01BDB
MSTDALAAALAELPLVDHHVHGALRDDVDRAGLELMLTESDRPVPPWMTQFDSQIGFAVRRWCAPVLGLAAHAAPDDYLARRHELGAAEVTRRLLAASGIDHYLLETGYGGAEILGTDEMSRASGRPVDEIVRLESVLEEVARSGVAAADLPERFRETLTARTVNAVGLKSIVAYRFGFDFDPARPADDEVTAAAGAWLAECARTGTVRVTDPVLLRFVLWSGVDRGCPSNCTPDTAIRTWSCTAAIRCCSPGSSGACSRTASTCCCCTATPSTATPAIWRRCSRMSSSMSGSG